MVTRDLVVVAGHTTLLDDLKQPENIWAEENWYLQSFQAGEVPFYEEHARHGVVQAVHNPEALLLFSGGRIRPDCNLAESASYHKGSRVSNWWLPAQQWRDELSQRVTTEIFARDSFENTLFSMLTFYRINGAWPRTITAVGWEFKRLRFDLHRRALRIPDSCWRYEGVNQPFDLAGALKGEVKAIAAFASSPYGCNGDLRLKRDQRNPHGDPNPYDDLSETSELLAFIEAGNEGLFPGKFPWEEATP